MGITSLGRFNTFKRIHKVCMTTTFWKNDWHIMVSRSISTQQKKRHLDILVESVLNLIFHLHAAELHHFGGHVLKYSSHIMETSSRMEFLAVGLKSNNCSNVSHAIVRETMTAITIQSLTSGVNISNMTRLFLLRTLLRISLRYDFIAQHEYFKDGIMFLPAPTF